MKIRKVIKDAFSPASIEPTMDDNRRSVYPMHSSYDPQKLSKKDYLSFYVGWSFVAISTIADEVASLQRQLTDKSGKNIESKELALIDNELLVNIVSFMKLNGACYVWKNRVWNTISELVVLRPDLVTPVLNSAWTQLDHWEYMQKKFPVEDIIPFVQFNPQLPYPLRLTGVSDVQAIATTIDWDVQASKWNRQFFFNSANPWGVLETDQDLSKDKIDLIKRSWEEKYRGTQNSNKVALLTGGLKYKPASPSQKEMDFIATRRFNRDEILGIYKLPPQVIGLVTEWSTGNIWKKDADMIFSRRTIRPLAMKIADTLNRFLFEWKGTFEFINIIPYDLTETRMDFDSGGMTLNEFRKSRGLKPVVGWDSFKSIMGIWEEVQFEEQWKSLPKKEEDMITKGIANAVSKSLKSKIKWTPEYRDARWEMKDKRIISFEKEYQKRLKSVFAVQEKDITKDFESRYSSQSKWHKATMPLLNTIKYSVLYYQILKSVQNELVDQEATKALIEVNIAEPANIFTPEIQKNLEANIKKFSFNVDQATNDKLLNEYQKIINEWLSVDQWVQRLKETVFTELKTSRLEKIVRTETIRAGNIWTQLWYEQSGVVEKKQRYTSQDERVCPFCWPEHGKVISLWDDFFAKGENLVRIGENGKPATMNTDYWSVGYPPLHPNCRCTILPVI